MKNYSKKLSLMIMSFLCVLFLFGCTSIRSEAADASGTLKSGTDFCRELKRFYEAGTGTIRIYCPTKIIFNADSHAMFAGYCEVNNGGKKK